MPKPTPNDKAATTLVECHSADWTVVRPKDADPPPYAIVIARGPKAAAELLRAVGPLVGPETATENLKTKGE